MAAIHQKGQRKEVSNMPSDKRKIKENEEAEESEKGISEKISSS